ncbi:response regulator transcription factor [Ornithinimicrobium pekingense]|uniref:DNA-binding response regulator n=1 Tax=Ornithinimicrobium pekingense TaxID=384677 RepID=A0ABQ2F8D4_9MICO|nr:response regulator transcription factor [Ornithinimicrobium pekingense]GGK71469.1 DNA-binding response regulator [Ornithinimicrobium pekingense]
MIRVVVADDQQEVRDGLAMMLSAEADIDLVGLAADGTEAVDLARADRPDVIVMDIRMPGIDGIEATRRITEEHHDDPDAVTAVLVITTFDADENLYGALQAGASGFMLKQAAPAGLAEAVRAVADGGAWIDPTVTPKVIDRLRDSTPVDAAGRPTLENLSKREIEVLRLMADAPTNTDLASMLYVSESTIKTHISRLLMKTGSHDRAQLVALAYRSGLVRP